MTIAADQLVRLSPKIAGEKATLYAKVLADATGANAIDTDLRIAHFLAQVAQETGGLRSLVESTAYKDAKRLDRLFTNVQGTAHAERLIAAGPQAIGNTIYANKLGNGNAASGDGFRFRGRGFLQVTGRANYTKLGKIIGVPLDKEPEQLGEPLPAARAAAAFWRMRDINIAADANDISTVTLLVNGPARLHLAERRTWLKTSRKIWAG